MEKFVNGTRLLVVLLVAMALSAAVSAQGPGPNPVPEQEITEVQPPSPKGSNPKPEDATKAILAAFDEYEVVGMSAAHGCKDLDDFILDLIRNPEFPSKVNDVAVECGNSLFQPILDRYIAGDDVQLDEVRRVWRNTTMPMCGVSAFYEELFPLVRRINRKLPAAKKLRVLAGDPPVDWNKVKSREDFLQFMMRDLTIASVMQKEVLSKHRKALMLFGTAHLYHGGSGAAASKSAVELYEQDYPGVTLVVADHTGFGNSSPLAKYNDEFESRMATWPVPSLVKEMRGTWLADLLDKTHTSGAMGVLISPGTDGKPSETRLNPGDVTRGFSRMVDAYLYLGPRDLLLKEPRPAEIFLNKDYIAELQRRAIITEGSPITDQPNPGKVSDRDYDPFLYDPTESRRVSGAGPSFQPALMPPPSIEHREIGVNSKLFDGYIGKYELAPGVILTITREGDRLFAQATNQPNFQMFPESERDYFLKAVDAQITFVTNAQGRATELILHQGGDHHAKRIE